MGKKYIIELEERDFQQSTGDGITVNSLFRVKGFNSLVFDWNGLQKLTPYIEPDTEAIRQEAYAEGYKAATESHAIAAERIRDDAYERGYNDAEKTFAETLTKTRQEGMDAAWECARKVVDYWMHCRSMEIFGTPDISKVFENNTPSETIEKIRAYEEQQSEIQVGDEVKCNAGWTAIVTRIKENELTLMDKNGAIANGYNPNSFIKTGRHFPEIAEVLAKMKGETT